MNELKHIDLNTGKFEANGKNYTVLSTVPLSRYKQYKKLQIELTYGMDIETLMKNCLKGYNYCDQTNPKPTSAGIVFHNIMNGLKGLEDDSREDAAILICTLIIAEEGEDLGVYDPDLAKQKIHNWQKAGYSGDEFFQLALLSLTSFKRTFALFTSLSANDQEISEK